MPAVVIVMVGIIFLLPIWFLVNISAFNIDVDHPIVLSDPNHQRGSCFGYALAFRSNHTHKWLVIGAPRANSTIRQERALLEPGVVFQCSIQNGCHNLVFHSYVNARDKQMLKHQKNYGLFGATIVSETSPNGILVICSPGWKNQALKRTGNYLMNGLCIINKGGRTVVHTPISNIAEQNFNGTDVAFQKFGQAGFSAALNNSDIYLGAPGIMDWTGSIIRLKKNAIVLNPLNQSFTKDDYLGYALAIGTFLKRKTLLVIGAPRGHFMTGYVIIADQLEKKESLNIIKQLNGEKTGEYFGSALLTLDIDGDGVDEIVVGAPNGNRVEIFSINEFGWQSRVRLDNENRGGYFGIALGSLGDIDGNGGMDLAIGAPFEDDGNGIVYIYKSCTRDSKRMVFLSQTIRALPGFQSWGSSFAPIAVDVDDNGIPDLAVGAYQSGKVAILRTRPVIYYSVNLKETTMPNMTNVTKLVLACIIWKNNLINADFEVTFSIDDGISDRAQLQPHYNSLVNDTMYKWRITKYHETTTNCQPLWIFLNEKKSSGSPLKLQFSVDLIRNKKTIFCSDCPMIDPLENKHSVSIQIPFADGCKNNTCYSDLKINSDKIQYKIILGMTKLLNLVINVSNHGEPAFRAKLEISLPVHVSLLYIPSYCEEIEKNIECEIGNPLEPNKNTSVPISLDTSQLLDTKSKAIIINLNVSSNGYELSPEDNFQQMIIHIVQKTQFKIYSSVLPTQITIQDKSNYLLRVIHSFHFMNITPILTNGSVDIWIPEKITNFSPFLVLFGVNSSPIKCYILNNSTLKKVNIPSVALPNTKKAFQELSCSKDSLISHCSILRCSIPKTIWFNLTEAKITVVFGLNQSNLNDIIKDTAMIRIIGIFKLNHNEEFYSYADTTISRMEEEMIPVFYFILAFFVGIIILGLLITVLYSVGFFDRYKAEERKNNLNQIQNEIEQKIKSINRNKKQTNNQKNTPRVTFQKESKNREDNCLYKY